jgi:nicotinate-nucleotide pyrophosphorylase
VRFVRRFIFCNCSAPWQQTVYVGTVKTSAIVDTRKISPGLRLAQSTLCAPAAA